MNKSQIISLIVTIGAFLDTIYGIVSENAGLLSELGVSNKVTKVIMLLGLFWTAFSKSLLPKEKIQKIGGSNPPTKDPKDK